MYRKAEMEVAEATQWEWERAGWIFIMPAFPSWWSRFEQNDTSMSDEPDENTLYEVDKK